MTTRMRLGTQPSVVLMGESAATATSLCRTPGERLPMPATPTVTGRLDAGDELEPSPRSRRLRTRVSTGTAGIWMITAGCLAFYLYHAFADQAYYRTTGFDLGIFDQAVRAYAHFQAPMVALKGAHYNIFGDHFHPIIAVLAPLYWIWNNVGMLLIAQAVLTAASVPVVYRF